MTSYLKITGWKLDQNERVCPMSVEFQTLSRCTQELLSNCVFTYLFSVYVCASRHGCEVRGQLAWVSFASSRMIRGTELKSSALVEGTLTCWATHPTTHPGMNFIYFPFQCSMCIHGFAHVWLHVYICPYVCAWSMLRPNNHSSTLFTEAGHLS